MIRRFKGGDLVTREDLFWNPRILYHYTTRQGLTGILSSQAVWATDVRYLNDASEYTYARLRFVDKLRDSQTIFWEPPYAQMIDKAIRRLSRRRTNLFAFCLCRSGDLLSQWRGYGGSAGYAIGFDGPALSDIAGKEPGLQIQPVYYNPLQQWELMIRIEASAARELARKQTEQFVKVLCDEFLKLAPFIKHPGFEEENEWRLVLRLLRRSSSRIRYRKGATTPIPYIPISLAAKGQPIPILSVIIGPNPRAELEKESVKKLLCRYKIKASVYNSETPYRES